MGRVSFQTEVGTEALGIEVQKFVDQASHTELILSDLDNGFWRITADSKQFWTHAATPREAQKMREEIATLQEKLSDAVELLRKWYEEGCEICDGSGSVDYVDDVTLDCECASAVCAFLASIEEKGEGEA